MCCWGVSAVGRGREEGEAYGKLASWIGSDIEFMCAVSPSVTMSLKWYTSAARSELLELRAEGSTRSLMSIAIEVKPVDERRISWWSGTGRIVLEGGRGVGELVCGGE